MCIVIQKPETVTMLGYADSTLYHEFFDRWTPESAYYFGLLAADGCIGGYLETTIQLSLIDYEMVLNFKNVIQSSNKINTYTDKNQHISHRFNTTSKHMTDRLKSQGIVPRKSLILKWSHSCPDELIHHLIRGYFDGDGSISYRQKNKRAMQLDFCGTEHFLFGISKTIEKHLNIYNANPRQYGNRKIFTLKYQKLSDLRRIIKWLYQDSNINTYLLRKYNKCQELLQIKYNKEQDIFGVRYKKNRWIVILDGLHIGTFDTKEEAIEAKKQYLITGNRTSRCWKYYEYQGEEKTLLAWSKDERCKCSQSFLRKLIKRGLSIEAALNSPVPSGGSLHKQSKEK